MSSNVGLSTPRGSGTSGYVQRNLSLLKPRSTGTGAPYNLDTARAPQPRKPDQAILSHDRLREVEVKVLELRDRLEDEEKLEEDEVDERCDALRRRLVEEMERKNAAGRGGNGNGKGKGLRGYQVHELAEAKAKESERLRRALGLKGDEVGGGGKDGGAGDDGEHPMARQERRRREVEAQRAREEIERVEREEMEDRERERRQDRVRERSKSRSRSRSLSRSSQPQSESEQESLKKVNRIRFGGEEETDFHNLM